MKTIARYLSAQSPLGPGIAGILSALVAMIVGAMVAPPLLWASNLAFGWWWKFWLG